MMGVTAQILPVTIAQRVNRPAARARGRPRPRRGAPPIVRAPAGPDAVRPARIDRWSSKKTAPKRRFFREWPLAYFQAMLAFAVDTAVDFALSAPARFTALTA